MTKITPSLIINQIPTSTLESVTGQIMGVISNLLTIRRKKCTFQTRQERPTLIMNDATIRHYLKKRLIINDNQTIVFCGEYRYQPELWKTNTPDEQKKIAHYVIEQNTIR